MQQLPADSLALDQVGTLGLCSHRASVTMTHLCCCRVQDYLQLETIPVQTCVAVCQ